MPSMMLSLPALARTMAVSLAALTLIAQERPPKPSAGGPIVVKVTTVVSGQVVEVEHPKTKKKATVARRMEWAVGKAKATTRKAVRRILDRVASDPATMRPDPATGGKQLAALLIAPGPNVPWGEVVNVLDAGKAAGFHSIDLKEVASNYVLPMAVRKTVVNEADLIVPKCAFCEPDESPPKDRLQIDVHRDGRIVVASRLVFESQAGHTEDLVAMRAELRKVRAKMEKIGAVGARPGRNRHAKRISMPVLIRADHEARWRDVHRLLNELTKPEVGFWKLQLAVAEISSRLR